MEIDNWQKGYAELSRQLATLKKENLAMKDELIKLRRTYEDQIDNLTLDNMPSVREIAIKTKDGVAGLVMTVDETVKKVEVIAANQTTQGDSIALIRVTSEQAANAASSAVASVEILTETITEQGKSIAAITQTTNELGAEVNIAVESASAANENVSNGAYLIARVNEDGSNAKIKADKVEIEGVVTFSDLKEKGKTTINGANIETGTISANKIAVGTNGTIDFSNLGSLYFLTPSGAWGEIRLNENEYEQGEILMSASGAVAINTDGTLFLDVGNLRINGWGGVTGTYSLGNGSITVVNGIVVNVVEGGGGGGGDEPDEPDTLLAPTVSINEDGLFDVSNPNGAGTLYYYTYWYDDYGGSEEGRTRTTSNTSVSGYADVYPPGGGWVGIYAHVIYNGKTSPAATDEAWFA